MGGSGDERGTHPDEERLVAYANGELSTAETAAVGSHLAHCARCTATAARYRLVGEVLRVPEPESPPPQVIARAKGLFAQAQAGEPGERPGLLEPLRRIVAQLVFDSGAGMAPAMAGFRGGGDRHLTYVAFEVQIDLRVQPPVDQGGAWRVQGQVDAESPGVAAGIDIVPAGEEQAVAHTTADEHGMFDLSAPAGRYDIVIRLPNALQVLPGLELG